MRAKVPIGNILLEKKVVDENAIDQALERQREQGGRLASQLLEAGLASEDQLLLALSEQHGAPAVDLSRCVLPLEALDAVPEEVAKQAGILPLRVEDNRILLAMTDPQDKKTRDELSFVTGKQVEPYVVLEGRLKQTVHEAYALRRRDPGLKFYYGSRAERGEGAEDPQGVITLISAEVPPAQLSAAADEELITIEVSPDDEVRPPSPAALKTVLVVDDEPDIVRLLEKALTAEGFRVVCATRGLEALKTMKQQRPDLVLLDAMLPEIHGFEICRKIKSSRTFSRVPVVMISAIYRGWRYAEDVKAVYGADDYFEKPFRLLPLVRRVRELLGAGPPSMETGVDASAAGDYYRQGVQAYKAGKLGEAEAALRNSTALDPFSANAHYALANVMLARNNIYEAIREFEQTIEITPELFAPLRNLAVLYQNRGFRNKAIEMWERALKVCPDEQTRSQIRDQLMKLL